MTGSVSTERKRKERERETYILVVFCETGEAQLMHLCWCHRGEIVTLVTLLSLEAAHAAKTMDGFRVIWVK